MSQESVVKSLRDLKAKSLVKLFEIKRQLLEKYPEKAERIERIIDLLAAKIHNLRAFTLSDYLFTLYQASKEFRELEELIPSPETISEILEREAS